MTNHVPRQETCLKMKEAGFPQGAMYYWTEETNVSKGTYFGEFGTSVLLHRDMSNYLKMPTNWYDAPLLTEILEQLPQRYAGPALQFHPGKDDWEVGYPYRKIWQHHKNPAEAAALLWLELHP